MLYYFFWVIPRRLNFIRQRFGTLCLFHLHRQVGVKVLNLRKVGVSIRRKVGPNIPWADWKEDDGKGWVRLQSRYCKGLTTHMETAGGYVKEIWLVRVGHGIAGQNCFVVGGCLLSLSLCGRDFQDVLKIRPSSLFILCGCISSSTASWWAGPCIRF
jgi:hypothetical protein